MEGKILKRFILATSIWTVTIMALIAYASNMISNMASSILTVIGLVILWLLVNSFIISHFFKRNVR
ncbi:hypothetical protein SDC9_131727 [bioreactor metagenome]|uniref:Uncharacterized protein n=1 Tax=bioreactor metagenome TaxID=1076179 RepID=A0A645D5R2_9ZZZZ